MREQKSVYLLMFFYYQCLFRACDLIGWRSSSCDVINPTQAHILIGVGGERITLMIVSNKKTKKWHFVPLWSRDQVSVLCHLPSSRDHVDIHKQVKLCPLVPSGAVKYILHVSKRPCRQNKLQLFEKIRQNFVYVMWLGSKCYVIVNDVVIVLLYITL